MKVFYGPDYVAAKHAWDTTRKSEAIATSLARRPIPGVKLVVPNRLDAETIARVHDPDYVEAVRTGKPRDLAQSQGFQWDPGLWTAVTASNGGAVEAALTAMQEGVAGSLSSGLHHARRAMGCGFCTFNGLALAALAALEAGCGSVIIIDVDAHCGDGTEELLRDVPEVRLLDVCTTREGDLFRPGHNTLDYVKDAEDYLPTLSRRLHEHAAAGPFGLALVNAGMDPHEDCPIGGMDGIDETLLRHREAKVFKWCASHARATAFVLAGGYAQGRLSQGTLVALHRLTIAEAAALSASKAK